MCIVCYKHSILTFMQTRDDVEVLHKCLEFSQPLECLCQAIQTQEKRFLRLKYCFFRKNTVTLPFTSNIFSNVKFHSTEFTRISAAALINQKYGAYLKAELNTIVIPPSTVFTPISAAALINSPPKCGAYLRAAFIRVITVIGSLRVYYI